MNGAAPVPAKLKMAPIISRMNMNGISHHFPVWLIKYHISDATLGFEVLAARANSLFGDSSIEPSIAIDGNTTVLQTVGVVVTNSYWTGASECAVGRVVGAGTAILPA